MLFDPLRIESPTDIAIFFSIFLKSWDTLASLLTENFREVVKENVLHEDSIVIGPSLYVHTYYVDYKYVQRYIRAYFLKCMSYMDIITWMKQIYLFVNFILSERN